MCPDHDVAKVVYTVCKWIPLRNKWILVGIGDEKKQDSEEQSDH